MRNTTSAGRRRPFQTRTEADPISDNSGPDTFGNIALAIGLIALTGKALYELGTGIASVVRDFKGHPKEEEKEDGKN